MNHIQKRITFLDGLRGIAILLVIRFVSYPLYLIHSNATMALTIKLHNSFNVIPKILLPILPMGVMILIAYIIAK